MVLIALGILVVSLLVIAHRYRAIPLNLKPTKVQQLQPTRKNDKPDISPVHEAQEKEESSLKVIASGVSGNVKAVAKRVESTKMKNPFADHGGHDQIKNNIIPPQTLKGAPDLKVTPSTTLMPPPSRWIPKSTASRTPPKPSNAISLRPPPSAASSLRALPGRLPQTSSLSAPSTSTLAPSSRPSKKVSLEPGHSPLDWAHLIANPPSSTFLRGADVPPNLIRVPPSLLKYHNGRKDRETGEIKNAWGVYQGKVYNLSPYLKFHPGGADQLVRGAGNTKAETLFNETHSWVSWDNMMGECLVGILVSENEAQQEDDMEEMD